MNDKALYLAVGLYLGIASYAVAQDTTSKDEQKLEQESAEVDKAAAAPNGKNAVETRLKSDYKVDDARIQSLRDQKMGYGEIKIALGLAEKLPGGITDANVKAIMDQRRGPPVMGWGQIARKQDTTIGQTTRDPKNAKAERVERREKRERPERVEKRERPERRERVEKAERPSSGKH